MFSVKYSIVVNKDTRPDFMKGAASNEFIDKKYSKCIILHYLEVFKYRKNANYERIAKDCDEFFFYEFVCAILRKGKDKNYIPCNEYNHFCPPEWVFSECKLLLKKKFKKN